MKDLSTKLKNVNKCLYLVFNNEKKEKDYYYYYYYFSKL